MPHLTLEYTRNLSNFDVKLCLAELNRALVNSGQFEELDIKSRALRLDDFLIGAANGQRAFAHLKLALLSGRTTEVKKAMSARLLERLRQLCGAESGLNIQLCVEVLEIERASYIKDTFTA